MKATIILILLLLWVSSSLLCDGYISQVSLEDVPVKQMYLQSITFVLGKGIQRILYVPPFIQIFRTQRNITVPTIMNVPLNEFTAPFSQTVKIEILPNFFSYKAYMLTLLQNQGYCGCCWAFAVCNVLADRLLLKTNHQIDYNLSAQQLLDCYDAQGCSGGSPEDCMLWLESTQTKMISAIDYPFRQELGGVSLSDCKLNDNKIGFQVNVVPGSVVSLVKFIPEDGYDIAILQDNIRTMKNELITNGPFFAAISVYSDFLLLEDDRVYVRGPDSYIIGGHAIEVIGYVDDNIDPRHPYGYWYCRNSWGDFWPKNSLTPGYFKIRMGYNECGIESRCGAAVPNVSGIGQLQPKIPIENMYYKSISEFMDDWSAGKVSVL